MKKLLGIGLVLVLMVAVPSPAMAATTTVYDGDQAGWEAAVGSWATEDFEDGVGPGISVSSTNGVVHTQGSGNKLWYDSLTYDGGPTATTTWTFDNPIYAFGGTWDLGSSGGDPEVGGPGSNIEVLMDGSWQSVGVIDNSYIDVFWGFVSDTSFTQVRLQAYNDEGWTERYTLDDMVYSFSPQVEVDKVWTMTNVCFEKDNDRDGQLSEDWLDGLDNDGDGLIDEDPDECEVTQTGTVIDELEALLKGNKIHTVTPGQFYAMSNVTISTPVDELIIEEDWGDCCDMLELNPKKGGGQVIVVYWNGADWEQIYDAEDPEVAVNATIGTAEVTLTDVEAGTYLVLVKFSPKPLKGETLDGQSCENINSATATIGTYEESDSATALLTVVER
jgi:hypothetical protein